MPDIEQIRDSCFEINGKHEGKKGHSIAVDDSGSLLAMGIKHWSSLSLFIWNVIVRAKFDWPTLETATDIVKMTFNLSKPNRTIRAGVILIGRYEIGRSISLPKNLMKLIIPSGTELLDVAPIDFFNGMSKHSVDKIPVSDSLKAQGLDIEFHWISEYGKLTRLSVGGSMETIVGTHTTVPGYDVTDHSTT